MGFRVQQLLRMAYAHIQMFLYRPFLHYISQKVEGMPIDQRYYDCAAACVSVARNIIHIAGEMKRRGLLNGSYWFYMYTTFFAILSLVFFVIENPSSPTAGEILHDAYQGRDTLASLAKRSMAADRCTQTLVVCALYSFPSKFGIKIIKGLFEQLPEKLQGVRRTVKSPLKRQGSATDATRCVKAAQELQTAPALKQNTGPESIPGRRSSALSNITRISGQCQPEADGPSNLYQHPVPELSYGQEAHRRSYNLYSPQQSDVQDYDGGSKSPASKSWSMPGCNQTLSATPSGFNPSVVPATDPLAYPNQPITAFGDQNFPRQESVFAHGLFDPNNAPSSSPEAIDAQLYGPMPPYSMQGQYTGLGLQQMNAPMLDGTATENANAVGIDQSEGTWGPQHVHRPDYGPLLEDNWSQQWINQAYRQ